jgi:Asp/Glu/hydantoin racemase
MLHTVSSLAPTFQGLCQELLPDVETFHMVDESLLKNTIRSGELTPTTTRRVLGHVASAVDGGADAVLVTCSSIGPAVALSRSVVSVPVMRVDEAMADLAVQMGPRIGVIATLPTTLHPTVELVQARANAVGKSVMVTAHLCAGAFEALGRGDTATHDALIADGLGQLLGAVDVVVLAQASMERVADTLSAEDRGAPILSSPRSGVERARTVLLGAAATEPTSPAHRAPAH